MQLWHLQMSYMVVKSWLTAIHFRESIPGYLILPEVCLSAPSMMR